MARIDTETLEPPRPEEGGFWDTFGSAIAALARRTGCSAADCPLPEIREAARDMRGLAPRHDDRGRLAA